MRFLFWNIQRKPLLGLVAAAARQHRTDVVILAENPATTTDVLEELREYDSKFQAAPEVADQKVEIFSRVEAGRVEGSGITSWVNAQNLRISSNALPLLLIAVHLPGKLWTDAMSQVLECARLSEIIASSEREAGHQRTILVGDFNMNPFEAGMVGAGGLHAAMDRRSSRGRVVRGEHYPGFYNPMWSKFGDLTPGPSGTYFYRGDRVSYDWNMFDQVLLRPDLSPGLKAEDIQILDAIGDISLLDRLGRPNKKMASDHLPIVFAVD